MVRKRKSETIDKEQDNVVKNRKKTKEQTNGETYVPKAVKQKRASKKVIVSEYFTGENEGEVNEKKPNLIRKEIDKNTSKGFKESEKNDAVVDDFEESAVKYRSPVRSKSSKNNKQNLTQNDKEEKVAERNAASRKRKSNESEGKDKKSAKRSKRSRKDTKLEDEFEPCDLEEEPNHIAEINDQDKNKIVPDKKSQGKNKRSTGKRKKDVPNDTEQFKEQVQETKEQSAGASKKQTEANVKKDKNNSQPNVKDKKSTNLTQNHAGSKSVTSKAKTKKEDTAVLPKTIDHTDVTAILLHMEGAIKTPVPPVSVPSTSELVDDDDDAVSEFEDSDDEDDNDGGDGADKSADNIEQEVNSDDSEEEEDWEEVEDHHGNSPKKSQIPDKPVEFTLDAPLLKKKRKKGEFDWATYLKRKMNRFKKEIAMEIHKVHLLCLTARTIYLHTMYQDSLLRAQTLSIVLETRELTVTSVKKCTSDQLGRLFSWIQKTFIMCKTEYTEEKEKRKDSVRARIGNCLENRTVSNHLDFALVCVLLLRQLGLDTRLMMSLQPLPFKATSSKTSTKGKSSAKKHIGNPAKITKSPKSSKSKTKPDNDSDKQSISTKNSCDDKGKGTSKLKTESSKLGKKSKGKKVETESKDRKGTKKEQSKTKSAGRKSGRRCSKGLPKGAYKDEQIDDDIEAESEDDYDPKTDGDSDEDVGKKKKNANGKGKKVVKKELSDLSVKEENSDSDFEEDSILIRTKKLRRPNSGKKNRKALSSESDSSYDTAKGSDSWIEVFLEREERWICIDCVTGRMDKPYDIEHNSTQPVTYVLGINNDGYVKDVTQRYASAWMTSTRKLRVEDDWWEETLAPYRNPNKKTDQREDQEIQGGLQKQPLPTSIGDFKSHPLYALERHLLKFEAIYPPSSVPVGYIRKEPVFARECVYTLHSRENWLKEGRAVRIGEEAYKYVKSRARWNRPKENPEAKDLEIFGIWQTEVYIPPPAVDGKVPRNSHGNVEMFLPSMLPAGTVHLKLPALNKIAKKLDIDCAPAMVGWDHHCGYSHPLMDGWIVCEEFKDILLAAWDEEQEIIKEREAAKREKRVYDNWRKLIRGLLIRERLKKTYDLESEKKAEPIENKPAKKEKSDSVKVDTPTIQEKATDLQYSWPQNRLNTKVTAFKVEEL